MKGLLSVLKIMVGLGLLALAAPDEPRARTVQAQQDEACPTLVRTALAAVETVCAGTGRNEACYGNVSISASPETLAFAQPGDFAPLAELESLRLSALDVEVQTWGISLLEVQANLPNDTLENVDVLLFGNVELTAGAGTAPGVRLTITPAGSNNLNIRAQPSTSAAIIGTLAPGATLVAVGRTAAGDWLHVELEDGDTGWIFAQLVTGEGDLATLAVVEGDAAGPVYGPMQQFVFRSGVQDRPCEQAPDSGILIQTPAGLGEITFLVNEVLIALGSTAYLQAEWGNELGIHVIDGQGRATSDGTTVRAPAGTKLVVPLDANGLAAGPPAGPLPYDDAQLASLPLQVLDEPVAVAPSLTAEEIVALVSGRLTVNSAGGICGRGPVTLTATVGPPANPQSTVIGYSVGGVWRAQAGVTVVFEAGGQTRLVSTQRHYVLLRAYSDVSEIVGSGNARTLTHTFPADTEFFVEIAGTTGDVVSVTATCE
jgi:hypothetical protein